MGIEIKAMTVAQLHAQLQQLVDRGEGDVPVCATDCVARYPFTAYSVLNAAGYVDALLIPVRPDAAFAPPDPHPASWAAGRTAEWNALAVALPCSPFPSTRASAPSTPQHTESSAQASPLPPTPLTEGSTP